LQVFFILNYVEKIESKIKRIKQTTASLETGIGNTMRKLDRKRDIDVV